MHSESRFEVFFYSLFTFYRLRTKMAYRCNKWPGAGIGLECTVMQENVVFFENHDFRIRSECTVMQGNMVFLKTVTSEFLSLL